MWGRGGKTEKERRRREGSRKGWYPVPCHCPAEMVVQERPITQRSCAPLQQTHWAGHWDTGECQAVAAGASGQKTSSDVQPGPPTVVQHGEDHRLELGTQGGGEGAGHERRGQDTNSRGRGKKKESNKKRVPGKRGG